MFSSADRLIYSHEDSVSSLSSLGDHILSTSLDTTARLYDYTSKTSLTLPHSLPVLGGALLTRAPIAVTSDESCSIRFWSYDEDSMKATHPHPKAITDRMPYPALSICVVDDCLFCGCGNDAVCFAIGTGSVVREYVGHTEVVKCVLFCDMMLFTGSADTTVRVWDPINAEVIRTFQGHKGAVTSLTGKDDVVISGSEDHTIRMWSASLGICLRVLGHHHDEVSVLYATQSLCPTRPYLYSCSSDYTTRCWSLHTLKSVVAARGVATSMTVYGDNVLLGMQLGG
eukprot:PhF_6_TR5245/c0_g1_i1/m.7608